MSFDLNSYVDVAERITAFYEKYPDGRLVSESEPTTITAGGTDFVVLHARAYRTPEDTHPGDGWAWEPVPGPTQFTKNSELMNAQTAAWGRAIVALGFNTKKIASREEVRNRQGANGSEGAEVQTASPQGAVAAVGNGADDAPSGNAGDIEVTFGKHKGKRLRAVLDVDRNYVEWLAGTLFEAKNQTELEIKAAAEILVAGGGDFSPADPADSDIPFERTI